MIFLCSASVLYQFLEVISLLKSHDITYDFLRRRTEIPYRLILLKLIILRIGLLYELEII